MALPVSRDGESESSAAGNKPLTLAPAILTAVGQTRGCSMDSCPTRPKRWVIAAAVLLSLALALLMVIAAAILIDLLSEVEALALLDLVPAVAIGWVLFRKRSPHPAPDVG